MTLSQARGRQPCKQVSEAPVGRSENGVPGNGAPPPLAARRVPPGLRCRSPASCGAGRWDRNRARGGATRPLFLPTARSVPGRNAPDWLETPGSFPEADNVSSAHVCLCPRCFKERLFAIPSSPVFPGITLSSHLVIKYTLNYGSLRPQSLSPPSAACRRPPRSSAPRSPCSEPGSHIISVPNTTDVDN